MPAPEYAGPPHWGAGHGMPRPVRLWLPVAVSALVQVPPSILLSFHAFRAQLVHAPAVALIIGLALLGPVALIWARRFPGPVVAVTAAGASADLLLTPNLGPPYVALAFAIVLAVIRGAATWAFASVATAWVVTLLAALPLGTRLHPAAIIALTLGVLICFGVGQAVRTRRDRFTAMRHAAQQRRMDAAQAERVRIARELHDVLAHSLSQINVQASVGLHLADRDPQKAAEALANIKAASKVALDDVRGVLGVLRDGEPGGTLTPQPDLSGLAALASAVSSDGPHVEVRDGIAAPPPGPVQMALYRIVQESLTNVVRHASATRVSVQLEEDDRDYLLTVTDDGAAGDATGAGRGILGMRERAELLGGTLTAAPVDAGFEVSARIPKRMPS